MQAVCFDMDGVLVDSEDHWVPLENERILPRAVPDADVTATEVSGMNFRDIYAYLDREYGTAIPEAEFVELFHEAATEIYTERVSLLPGFEPLAADLHDAGVAVALVSSSPHDWIDLVLDRFTIRDQFDRVISAEEVDGPSKPDPAVFEYAAAELGLDPADCVAVEDSTHGVASATAAGMVCIGYAPVEGRQDLSAADYVATDPEGLQARLRELTL